MSKSIKNAFRLIACALIVITIIISTSFEEPVWATQPTPQNLKFYKADQELGAFLDKALLKHKSKIVFYTMDRSLMEPASPTFESKLDYCSIMLYGIKHKRTVRWETVMSSDVVINLSSKDDVSQSTASVNSQRVAYYKVTIKPKYKYSKAKDRKFYKKVQRLAKKAKKKKGVRNRAKFINNYIVSNVRYKKLTRSSRTAYSALMKGEASCQGYTDLFTIIARESGMEAETVCGFARLNGKKAYHAWNLVKTGKKWVQIDTTFNDLGDRYRYFMRAKKTFNKNHKLDSFYNNKSWKKSHPIK